MYVFIIVGGGVAGFFTAIQILEHNNRSKVLILEKNKEPLKKLLITGSGACNFTHAGSIDEFLQKYGKNGKFLRNAFYTYFNDDIVSFFNRNGVKSYCRDDGKYFPKSMKASDIKAMFIEKTKTATVKFSQPVDDIKKVDDEYFCVYSGEQVHKGKNVVITTGGLSFKGTGSTGDGYELAKKLGHTIAPLKSGLANVELKEHKLSEFSGIAFNNAIVSDYRSNKKLKQYNGALLITHKGLSGPVVIDNSRDFEAGDVLKLNFLGIARHEFDKHIKRSKDITIMSALRDFDVPKKMLHYFIEQIGAEPFMNVCNISNKKLNILSELLCDYMIEITKLESFSTCMVTVGGVSLNEVDRKSMQSKLVSGLYFVGEVLDIDGDSGGYNLQAIFSEAALLAKAKFS